MRRTDPEAMPIAFGPQPNTDPKTIIAALQPFVTAERLARIDAVLEARIASVVAVLEEINDPHNASAVMRSAEAFGVQDVYLIQQDPLFLASRPVAQGTQRWVDLHLYQSRQRCLRELKSNDFKIYVADGQAPNAYRLDDLSTQKKVALVFGNEHAGVSAETRALADGCFSVAMRGFVESLNVSVAAAIGLHQLTVNRQGDLSAERKEMLKARFMLASVDRGDEIVQEQLTRMEKSNGSNT